MRFLTIFFLSLICHNAPAMSLLQARDCDTIFFKNGRVFYAWVLDTVPGNIRYWDYGASFDNPLKSYRLNRIDSIKKGKVSSAQNGVTSDNQSSNSKKRVDWEDVMSKWSLIASYTSLFVLILAVLNVGLFWYFLFLLVVAFGLITAFLGYFKSKDDPEKFQLFRRSKISFYPFIFFALLLAFMINKFLFFY